MNNPKYRLSWKISEEKFVLLQNQGQFYPKIDVFWNFDKVLAKIIQYSSENIYDNVHSDGMRICFAKNYPRKWILKEKYSKN